MKKVGIMTICKCNNYGAELQAFATYRILTLLGYDAEIIDYIYYKTWNFKDTKMSNPLIPRDLKGRLSYWVKYRLVNAVVDNILPLINARVSIRSKRFNTFHKENSKFSRRYSSMDELYGNVPEYDVYLTGSDQVWNPSASSSIEPYFLTFAPKGKRRISYASSFGVSSIEESLKEKYKEWLKEYDEIAVRENKGVQLVEELTGKKAYFVVDPTLLLSKKQWTPFMKQCAGMPDKYVLIYQLLPSELLPELALKIAKENNCKVYFLAKRAFAVSAPKGVEVIYDAGPSEFLSLICNAMCVVTNSFHGTAFAVNFGVPFYAVLNPSRGGNARIISILEQVKLQNHIVYEGDDWNNIHCKVFDYKTVTCQLEALRSHSLDYLTKALR